MLTIPSTVTALLKADSCRKNFRVKFPNGEMSDLTNADLIRESVRFTESCCSRESFRFGLAESSVMEFETVGVADMRGMTIRCFCDVDVSSLSAAEISAIQAGTWDGTLVLAASSDLGWAYFEIPFGEFVVASCPRDHESMVRRKVKAYSPDYFATLPLMEAAKVACPITEAGSYYKPYVVPLFFSLICRRDDAALLQAGFTKVSDNIGPVDNMGAVPVKITVTTTGGDTLEISVASWVRRGTKNIGNQFQSIQSALYKKNFSRKLVAAADAALEALNVDYSAGATVTGDNGNSVTVTIGGVEDLRYLISHPTQVYGSDLIGGTGVNIQAGLTAESCLEPYVYYAKIIQGTGLYQIYTAPVDYATGDTGFIVYNATGMLVPSGPENTANGNGFLYVPESAAIKVDNITQGTTDTYNISGTIPPYSWAIECWHYTPPNDYPLWNERLTYKPNGEEVGVSNFVGTYNPAKIVNDFLELLGAFASPARTGGTEIFHVDSSSPVQLLPEDYRSFWWDEHGGSEAGTIRFPLTINDEDVIVDFAVSNGEAIYDMRDNTLLQGVGMSLADAQTFLLANLAPRLAGLALDTLDAETTGRPDVECGDFLDITAADGTEFLVCLTRRELRGIQALSDALESVGTGEAAGGGFGSASGTVTSPEGGGETTKWTKVWENPSPSASFPAQTINGIDLSRYSWAVVEALVVNSNINARVTVIVAVGTTSVLSYNTAYNNKLRQSSRDVTIGQSSATFAAAYNTTEGSNTAITNTLLVPYRIWGLPN